ncbi:MAG: hypothetical protein DSY78_01940 [Chloroflexi bacterium]|nr:hypothetical protein [Dehalococcoidia bacterium]PKB81005.1 MAG: hypothetical protein BZY84_07915 [SAR202 cluster bacterium MP-SInd-SRR3963457-G1]PKB85124.1 MAG: hypothetical protein BZY86_03870 [SAR202 cluster bacterium MP-NPac-SRR3961935-G1]RUA32874.1 MAG: hypothetical protein DSY78_01940 [Chloroflexota bacterium]
MDQAGKNTPSGWWYLLAALLAAAGVAVFVVLRISSTDPSFRLILPGSQQITLENGNYTLFYEHTTILNGTEYTSDTTVPEIRFFVMAPDQSGVELTVPAVSESYAFDGREGYSVVKFTVDSPDEYTVGGGYTDGRLSSLFVFALGRSRSGSLLLGLISIVGGLGIAAALVTGLYVMRRPRVRFTV